MNMSIPTDLEKLTMSNWPSFKIDFIAFLQSRGLKQYLFKKNPHTSEEEEAFNHWEQESDKVAGAIMMCCSKSVRHYIVDIEPAVDRWSKLAEVFEKRKGNEWSLLGQLYNMSYDGSDIDGHIAKIKDIHSQLLCRFPQFPEFVLTSALMNSVRHKHASLVSSLYAREALTFDDVVSAIQLAESADKGSSSSSPLTSTAFFNRSNKKQSGQSYNQQKKKHCNFCKKSGHVWNDCRSRLAQERKNNNNTNNSSRNDHKANIAKEFAFSLNNSASLSDEVSSFKFFIDSGASRTTSRNVELFSSLMSNSTDQIHTGTGAVIKPEGIGQLQGSLSTGSQLNVQDAFYAPDIKENLLSVSQLTDKGSVLVFQDNKCVVYSGNSRPEIKDVSNCKKFTVRKVNGMYPFHLSTIDKSTCQNSSVYISWHNRLGHLNNNDVQRLGFSIS